MPGRVHTKIKTGKPVREMGYFMTHKEKAEQLLKHQYHCSQALFGAFADDFDMDLKTAFKISTCFGGGMRQGGLDRKSVV